MRGCGSMDLEKDMESLNTEMDLFMMEIGKEV